AVDPDADELSDAQLIIDLDPEPVARNVEDGGRNFGAVRIDHGRRFANIDSRFALGLTRSSDHYSSPCLLPNIHHGGSTVAARPLSYGHPAVPCCGDAVGGTQIRRRGWHSKPSDSRAHAEACDVSDFWMKIACVGGGPAGLYFAISMKLR